MDKLHPLLKSAATRLLWALISVSLLICFLWTGLHLLIVPRIDSYKQAIQDQASRALGLHIEIGHIQSQGGWWVPWFEINEVVLFDAQGHEALRLPRVLAAISPHALVQGQFEHLVIERPELDIRKDEQGQIWIAGLSARVQGDSTGANWFFSQPEFVVQKGRVRWKDETRGGKDAAVLQLTDVDFLMKNPANTHQLRLDITPPAEWGQRLSLRGKFHQLPWHDAGDFSSWTGELFADLPQMDVSNLRQWITWDRGLSLQQGRGGLKVWADWTQGAWTGVNADIALDEVDVRLGEDLRPLNLRQIRGNLGGKWKNEDVEISSHDLMFDTQEGEHWPGGDVRLSWQGHDFKSGTVYADKLDISALSQISQRLPLPEVLHTGLQSLQPKGQLAKLEARWQTVASKNGEPSITYSAKGQLHGLGLTQDPTHPLWAHWPGIEGANIDFDLTQEGGQAKVELSAGHLVLPKGFDNPDFVFDQAQAQIGWQLHGQDLTLQINNALVSNADASGRFSGSWKNGTGDGRYPGVVDLNGSFEHVNIKQVHRYLPDLLPTELRSYLHDALDEGQASNVTWKIKGDLKDFPFKSKAQGEFKVSAQIENGRLVYVPASIASPKQLPWPALNDIHGELVFDQQSMRFKGNLRVQGTQKLVWPSVEVSIPDLLNTEVVINAQGKGPLTEVTDVISHTAINELTQGVLEKALSSGEAEYSLNLKLPIQQLAKSKVQGSVTFLDNDVQIVPLAPVVGHAKGVLQFTEQHLSFKDVRGMLLGGDAQIQGTLSFTGAANEALMPIRINGRASAEGLRQARELGFISRLALRANGRIAYDARLGFRRGQLEMLINSDLKGMSVNLPTPLNKTANTAAPLRVEIQLTRDSVVAQPKVLQDQIKVSIDRVLAANYVRDLSSAKPHVLRGNIAIGQVPNDATTRNSGVALSVKLSNIDLDDWNDIQTNLSGAPLSKALPKNNRLSKYAVPVDDGSAAEYLPTQISMQVDLLKVANRNLHQVVAGGTQVGDVWRLNLKADELSGYTEIRPGTNNAPAQLYARLAYLNIPPNAVNDVENMLDDSSNPIPALDVVINELTLRGKKLGRLEIDAINRTNANNVREWHLNKFNITVPEASLNATGSWETTGAKNRRTQLDFSMDVHDSGELLTRLGTPSAIKSGHGKLTGNVSWAGSPLAFDYPTMSGKLNLNIEKGQFLKSEPGAARLLGVLSLQALPRRLTLDFSDVFSEGFAFDFVRGDVRIDQGVAFTNNLQMKGVSAAAVMEGSADLSRETQDLKVVVAPEISASAYSLYMATINPVVGLTSYLAQLVLSKPLVKATTNEFHIDGSWANPRVTKVN